MSGPSQATTILDLVNVCDVEFFHTVDGDGYADVPVRNHTEIYPIRSKGFRRWLARLFYRNEQKAPNAQAMQDALGVMDAGAQHDGPEHQVYIRIAEANGRVYLDLADSEWKCIEIGPDGWKLLTKSPVRFRRRAGMLPLPVPQTGGSIDALRDFLNVGDDDWPLMIACLTAYLRATGPYPVLNLVGEQGTAKSTAARVLRRLVDPNKADVRAEPREVRDLVIAANNGWIINLDNVSHLPAWLSDALCRMSTGGGFATRELYENDEEVIFDAQRPVILNGIADVATRSDLLDRSVIVTLPQIPEERRRAEADFWADFNRARPHILGALLDAVSIAIGSLSSVRLAKLPRMADFAKWVVAAEPGLGWEAGAFIKAYAGNRETANEIVLESWLATQHIRQLVSVDGWTGTATDLLKGLNAAADEVTRRLDGWPKNARRLSGDLRRLAPNFRAAGIMVRLDHRESGTGRRLVRIEHVGNSLSRASRPSPLNTDVVTQQALPVTQAGPGVTQLTSPNGHSRVQRDDHDGRDAEIPTQSTAGVPAGEVSPNGVHEWADDSEFVSLASAGTPLDEETE